MALTRRAAAGHRPTYAVLAVGVGAFTLLQSLVIPVLAVIQQEVRTSQAAVTWLLTAYLLSAAACTPILGRLGDMIGKRKVLVGVLLALAGGCLLAGLAGSLPLLVVARVLQGAGGGLIPLAFGIIRDQFPEQKVAGAVGVVAGLASAGVGIGIVIAGPIVDALDWHWLFWLPMIMILLAAAGAWLVVPDSPARARGRVNWFAAVLLTVWLVALLLGVSRAPTWGWGSPLIVVMLVVAAAGAAGWILVESRSAHPLIDMRMMRVRGVWTTNLVALLIGVAMYASFAFLPQFLQTPTSSGYGFGVSVTESGFLLLPQAVASFALGLSAGPLARRFGSKNLLVVGSAIAAVGYLAFALWHGHVHAIYGITLVMGIGFGLAFSAMSNLIVVAVPPEQTGVASGMNANIRTIGGSLGAAAMASLVTGHLAADGYPRESGYTAGFLMLAGALVVATAAALLVPAIRREPATGVEPDVDLRHAEMALLAGGTVVGDEPE